MTHGHVDVRRQPQPINRIGPAIAAGAMILAVAPTGPTLIALGLLVALLTVINLDGRRPQDRFTMRRPLVRSSRFEAWRAWDGERDRWCVLVIATPARAVDNRAALAEARRVLRVGPAYDTEVGPHGPIWVFEA